MNPLAPCSTAIASPTRRLGRALLCVGPTSTQHGCLTPAELANHLAPTPAGLLPGGIGTRPHTERLQPRHLPRPLSP
jgi:hypothetical protein